jgi:hypothetical protein
MRNILAMDPGATRAGWAILGDCPPAPPTYIASGVEHCPRLSKKHPFQKYRMELTDYWVGKAHELIEEYNPSLLISETVPSRGAGIPEQLYVANVMITTVHAIAIAYGIPVEQVSARTVQAKMALRKPNVKVTKPQVRNGVLTHLPEIKERLMKDVKVFEESDALAIGLWYLGVQTNVL